MQSKFARNMMAQKLMSENKDNPFNSRFFQPSDAMPPTGQDRRSIAGLGYFLPVDVPKYSREDGKADLSDARLSTPQLFKDIYSGMMKFDKIRKGEATLDEIKKFGFDASMNLAGGGMLGSKIIPNAVPPGSIGVFAGKSATNFPAKSLLKETDDSKFLQLNNELQVVKNELTKGRMNLGDEATDNLQIKKKQIIDELDNEAMRLLKNKQTETADLDKFMEKQDYRTGLANPVSRFEGSKREFGTGLFQLPDGQYRFEIDDTVAKMKNLDNVFVNQGEFTEVVANVAGAKNIQLDAMGSLKTFFNSKNAVNLSDILNHKELFDNYPQLKNIKIAFYNDPNSPTYGAFYSQKDFGFDGININAGFGKSKLGDNINLDTPENKEKILDILVHEIQHKIQDIENFTPGSNLKESSIKFLNFKNRVETDKLNAYPEFKQFDNYQKELSSLRDAQYLKQLDELVAKGSGYQPRQLFNSSDWYQFGDQIRSELAKELGYTYPKVKSAKRDVWIKGAFGKLRDKALREMRLNLYKGKGENVDEVLDQNFSLKELKSQIGKLERKQDKHFKGYLEYTKLNRKLEALENFEAGGHNLFSNDAFDKYQIILGEAEARAVQARRGKTILDNSGKYTNFEKTYFPFDQFKEGKMVRPPSYFNLQLDDLVT